MFRRRNRPIAISGRWPGREGPARTAAIIRRRIVDVDRGREDDVASRPLARARVRRCRHATCRRASVDGPFSRADAMAAGVSDRLSADRHSSEPSAASRARLPASVVNGSRRSLSALTVVALMWSDPDSPPRRLGAAPHRSAIRRAWRAPRRVDTGCCVTEARKASPGHVERSRPRSRATNPRRARTRDRGRSARDEVTSTPTRLTLSSGRRRWAVTWCLAISRGEVTAPRPPWRRREPPDESAAA